MTWVPEGGSEAVGDRTTPWKMEWSARGVPVHSGQNSITVTVEDIKGLRSSKVLVLGR